MRVRSLSRRAEVDLETSSLNELVSSPGDKLGRQQELAQIRGALRMLPVEQQVLLELRYWHDLDASALAEVFGLNPGAIRVRLSRARRALRTQLGAQALDAAADDGLSRSLRNLDDDEPESQ
jgi:RNA polymerase sigma-70 factor (ECF subfamily)